MNQKLQQIRRDPLFDEQEAAAQWNVNYIELQAIEQQHMRAVAAQRRQKKKKQNTAQEPLDVDTDANGSPSEVPSSDDDGGVVSLGGIFEEPADTAQAPETHLSTEGSIRLLDLAKWSGLSPRRLLDELCKGHDSKCRIHIRTLAQTSYSARHKLEILWTTDTTPEAQAVAALPAEVEALVDERAWKLEMSKVAASSVAQSEAYICTLALFLLSSIGSSELKGTSRLPTVWRDLLKDLTEIKQKLVDEGHKTDLRRLRTLILETKERLKRVEGQSSSGRSQIAFNTTKRRRMRPPAAAKLSPEEVCKEWDARTSRLSFQQMLQIREQLPVHQFKDSILSCISHNPVSIICAETGAGKSSGIPVLLLEQELGGGRDCRILVTQPRRISAVTLARRVSQELGENRNDIGTTRSLVGYAIRLESKTSNATRITYATTGVLLRMLEESPDLDELDYL